jgi:hypothetical protein
MSAVHFHGYKISPGYRKVTVWTFDRRTHQRVSISMRVPTTTLPEPLPEPLRYAEIASKLVECGITPPAYVP